MDTATAITQTQAWLSTFIIKYNICPFAKREFDHDSIHYAVVTSDNTEYCLQMLFSECQRLDKEPTLATTLIIYPENFIQFDDYLDFLDIAESLLIEQGYEGIYQLASFHPDYCFDGESESDPANYTNRSPYPMLHIIREASLEKALNSYPNPELIPQRNIQLTRAMGLQQLRNLLTATKPGSKKQ